jgi:pantothenate kinase
MTVVALWLGLLSSAACTCTVDALLEDSYFPFDEQQWWQSFWSFLAGAGIVALLWAWQTVRNLLPDEITADDMSWVDPWNTLKEKSWQVIVENSEFYYQHHIGEMPRPKRPRRHWPWETIGRRVFSEKHSSGASSSISETLNNSEISAQNSFQTADEGGCLDEEDGDETIPNNKEESKDDDGDAHHNKEFCIGSIFGMDVGGTLAKLVYFEQKATDYDPLVNPSRERQYAMAASAQAVLMARNSMSTSNIHLTNTSTMTATSSTYRLTGETKDNFGGQPASSRRRSLSLGCMGRFKDLQKQMYETNSKRTTRTKSVDVNDPRMPSEDSQERQQTTPRRKRHSNRPMHSVASKLDLDHLKDLRQESVPDDLSLFRGTVHFEPTDPALASHSKTSSATKDESSEQPPIAGPSMKKSRSMFNLSDSQQKKAVALDRFYSFARRLDSYENSVRDHQLSFFSRELGGEFHFLHFESRWMTHAMDLIRYHNLHLSIAKMGATGGGAHKYAKEWDKVLGIQMDKQDELDSLVAGMQFVLSTVVGECYTFRPHDRKQPTSPSEGTPARADSSVSASSVADSDNDGIMVKDHQVGAPLVDEPFSDNEHSSASPTRIPKNYLQQPLNLPRRTKKEPEPIDTSNEESTSSSSHKAADKTKIDEWWWSRKVQRDAISYSTSYPYLLVTIGTGVSILRVDGPRKHERISGSSIGGGTYWGLMRLLTDVEDFEDVMRLAEKGDPAKVDMMVGDIYGDNSDALEKLGLPSNIVASSFGKLVAKEDPAAGLEQEDLARALLLMITNNIGQVAYLNAKLHSTPRIYFVGNFLRNNTISQRRLSYAIDYWSKGEMEALFLEHEGYFGALGAFLMSQKIAQDDGGFFQWGEDRGPSHAQGSSGSKSRDTEKTLHRRTNTFGA